jgi:hypothetical protein
MASDRISQRAASKITELLSSPSFALRAQADKAVRAPVASKPLNAKIKAGEARFAGFYCLLSKRLPLHAFEEGFQFA